MSILKFRRNRIFLTIAIHSELIPKFTQLWMSRGVPFFNQFLQLILECQVSAACMRDVKHFSHVRTFELV